MPLAKKIEQPGFQLAIWRIEEDISFFTERLTIAPHVIHKAKQLQWLASRYLAKEVLGERSQIENNALGMPYIVNSTHRISISHTPTFAAVMVSAEKAVGLDIEFITPKVERIAHKFLTAAEIDAIHAHHKTEKLLLYWSAKESLFKFYSKGVIEFKTQLIIEPFELNESGTLHAAIKGKGPGFDNLTVHYAFFESHVLTYMVQA